LLALLTAAVMTTAPPATGSFLREYAETRQFGAGRPASAKLTPDGEVALFLRSPPRSPVQALFETDLRTGRTRQVLDAEALLAGAAQSLTKEERAQLERQRVSARGFTRLELSRDGRRAVLGLSGRLYLVERATGAVQALHTGEAPLDPRLSPDATRLAYVRAHDVHVLDLARNEERRLTAGGSEEVTHGLAEFVAQEEMDRFAGYWWSPDGRFLAFEEADLRPVEKLAIVDPMHPERGAETFAYPRAGRDNARVRLGVVPVEGGPPAWVSWDVARYPYLFTAAWQEGGPLALVVMNRAQTEAALLAADPATGATRLLVEERDPVWLDLAQGFPRWLEDGSGFLWRTERRGGPEVELRAPDGALRAAWVKPEHGFQALVGVDARRRWLWFTGGPDPTAEELFVVKDGAAPERVAVASEPARVTGGALSRDGRRLVVTRVTARELPRTLVLGDDGARIAELPGVAAEPPFAPTTEYRKVGAGEGLWAALVRPRTFTPGKKLPVIVEVYGGPKHQSVARTPKLVQQWMADQGFLVVSFDGRGSPRRGRVFERALRGDMGGVNLEDQVTGLRALAAEVPELDLGRVGITGWSYGGYLAALAVMKRPDVYRAAVAGAPVADWRDYDTFYTERYLGLPQEDPAAYDRSSLLTWAPKLARPLLVMHGTADDNVYFFHSLKLSDALYRAGKPHAFLPLSGLTHMTPEPLVVERRFEWMMRFFEENL
jgi:dipeptidyl-peptidase 4